MSPVTQTVRGATYQHRDGRRGILVGSHPDDGALLVLNEIDREDDDILVFFACERSDLLARVEEAIS